MKKKLFIALLAVVALVCLFTVAVSADEITYSADFGDVTVVDGMPTIEGISTSARVVLKNSGGTYTTYPTYYIMKDSTTFGTDYTNLNANNSLGETYTDASMILVEIPDGVTAISSGLFGMDSDKHPTTSLEKIVILSDDYTKITEQTFRKMPTVKSVTLSKSITEIDSWGFCGSTALQEVILPEGTLLQTLGNSFSGCSALTTFKLSNAKNLVSIGAGAFDSTLLNESINLSGCTTLKSIGNNAFKNAKVTGLNLSGCTALETIGNYAFENATELTFVDLSGTTSLVSIGEGSFTSSKSIASVTFEGSSLKTISSTAFNYCTGLRNITLCDSIETIGSKAFYRIGEVTFASNYLPKNLTTVGTHLFSGCIVKNEVLYFPEGFTALTGSYHFNDDFKPYTELTLVFLGKMTEVNLPNMGLTAFTNNGSQKPLTIIFAQNSFDELNGDFLQGTDINGTHGYIITNADGTTPYTAKSSGSLTVNLCNNDPNTSSSLGTDANGNTVYKAEGAPATLVFCGSDTVEFCYSVRNSSTDKGWYRFFTTEWTYDIDAHTTAGVHYDKIQVVSTVNCGYDGKTTNTCVVCDRVIEEIVPATGDHKYTVDTDCTTGHDCTVCEKTIIEALSHATSVTVEYANGFFFAGEKITACTNEGCAHEIAEELEELFIADKGYSTEGNGTGISHTLKVNHKAIDVYEGITGETIKYGTVAAAGDSLGTPVSVKNGKIVTSSQAVASDMTGTSYTLLVIKITGIPSGAKLNCNAYIAINEAVYYLCGTETRKDALVKEF